MIAFMADPLVQSSSYRWDHHQLVHVHKLCCNTEKLSHNIFLFYLRIANDCVEGKSQKGLMNNKDITNVNRK